MPAQRQESFRVQLDEMSARRLATGATAGALLEEEREELTSEISNTTITLPFESKFAPFEMRQLALVAHNHMKPAMKEFIETFSEVLKKFRITGTQTTMRMCKTLWGEEDDEISYGLTCTSGPLGGDAQIAALMCIEDLGGLIFFVDPLSAHPHQADIDSLCRLTNCGNVIVCTNPTSAMSMMHILKLALQTGNRGLIPSFFETLESPAVAEYKRQQELALAAVVSDEKPRTRLMQSMIEPLQGFNLEEDDDGWSCTDSDKSSAESTKNSSENAREDEGEKNRDSMDEGGKRDAREMHKQDSIAKLYGVKKESNATGRKTLKKLGKGLKKHLTFSG